MQTNLARLFLILFLVLIFVSSCCSTLVVYTRYHSYQDLASHEVLTPDPRRCSIDVLGQSLVIDWRLPKNCGPIEHYYLDVLLRLENDQEFAFATPLRKRIGTWEWSLKGCPFFEKGRIITYRVFLMKDDEVIAEWIHPLFVELITFEDDDDDNDCNE